MRYTIVYLDNVVKKALPALDAAAGRGIKRAIEERLMKDPVVFGKPFHYSLKGHRRLRVGDCRVREPLGLCWYIDHSVAKVLHFPGGGCYLNLRGKPMPTKNPRINITLDPRTADIIARLAKERHVSLSSVAQTLIIEALEQHEDLALSEIAKLRDKPKTKRYSHTDAWKQ
ncbi:MAG: DUF6290 family protein [Candidatus Dependentiae bacterium]|nr:DUF6290 family protein [Candidatus Dependentiae bacterium]